jgi:hypothetical protein
MDPGYGILGSGFEFGVMDPGGFGIFGHEPEFGGGGVHREREWCSS